MSKVVIIGGGGQRGMAAAIGAAECGHDVSVYEKNEKLGKKRSISRGKGRCNLTNGCDTEDLFRNMVSNGKFLYSAIYGFTNFDIVDLVEGKRLPGEGRTGSENVPGIGPCFRCDGGLRAKDEISGSKDLLK